MNNITKNIIAGLLISISIPQANSQITLENSKIRLVTDGKHILSVYDKERGFEHVSNDYTAANGIFGIRYVNNDSYEDLGTIHAGSISNVTLQNSSSTSATYLVENDLLKATVTANLSDTEAEVSWNIKVEMKNAAHAVGYVDFPRMRTPQKYGDSYKEFIEPTVEGMKRYLSQAIHYWRNYPGKQTMQIGICLSPAGGFSMWTDDTKGNVKSFGYTNAMGSSNFAVRHLPAYSQNWESVYATRISLHGKDWQDGADIYRKWVEQQYWCKTPLRNREDTPELLHSPPLVISTQLDREDLSTLVSRLKAWEKKFGAKIIYRPLGWEKYGNWVGPDYFPVSIGEDNFLNLNAALKEAGITVSGFPEPYHWVTGLTDGSASDNAALQSYFDDHNGAVLCRVGIDGNPHKTTNENRHTAYLCRGTDHGKAFHQWVANELFDRGVTHIHNDADHMVDLGGPCMNPDHGHPVPYGTWEADIMNQVFTDIVDEAKNRQLNDFILSRENGYEIQNMILHGYQARYFQEFSSRRNLIPLYLYVYHDYIPAIYGLVTANASRNIQLCGMVIYGQIPSIAFWNSYAREPNTNVIDQNSANVLKDYYDLMKTHGKDFLLYGKMMRPALQTATGTMHTCWEDGSGRIGVFAVDTMDSNTSVTVKVPGTGLKYMNKFTGDSFVSAMQVTGGQVVTWDIPKWRLCSAIFTDESMVRNELEMPERSVMIYPNPAEDNIYVDTNFHVTDFEIHIFDMSGKNLGNFVNKNEISLQNLDPGMYLFAVKSDKFNSFHKIIKH